jgi:chromosome partitioning protein
MRKIAMLNQKGGVGKTTSVVNIAAALAIDQARVVAVDFDPQAHLTIHLGAEPDTIEMGTYKVLTDSVDFTQAVTLTRPNLWLLGANINLVGAESELVSVVGRETIFREAIASGGEIVKGKVIGKETYDINFRIPEMSQSERDVILSGCLINYYQGKNK